MIIELTRQKRTLLDDEDMMLVQGFRWYAQLTHGIWYAVAYMDYSTVSMHRVILGFPKEQVHHINGDGLDNRRSNIVVISAREHSYTKHWPNKSGYRGVCFEEGRPKPWAAHIRIPGTKTIHKIGRFETPQEAARAYDELAKKYHGKYATVNFSTGI